MIVKIGAVSASVNGNDVDMNNKFDRRNVSAMLKAAIQKKGK